MSYPSGLAVEYRRDAATGQVTQVVDAASGAPFASGIAHLPRGPVSSLTFGNGLGLSQTA